MGKRQYFEDLRKKAVENRKKKIDEVLMITEESLRMPKTIDFIYYGLWWLLSMIFGVLFIVIIGSFILGMFEFGKDMLHLFLALMVVGIPSWLIVKMWREYIFILYYTRAATEKILTLLEKKKW